MCLCKERLGTEPVRPQEGTCDTGARPCQRNVHAAGGCATRTLADSGLRRSEGNATRRPVTAPRHMTLKVASRPSTIRTSGLQRGGRGLERWRKAGRSPRNVAARPQPFCQSELSSQGAYLDESSGTSCSVIRATRSCPSRFWSCISFCHREMLHRIVAVAARSSGSAVATTGVPRAGQGNKPARL